MLGEYIALDETAVMPDAVLDELHRRGHAAHRWPHGMERARVRAKDLGRASVVLVQGTGGVSMFAIQFAKLSGARVVMTSSSDEKLAKVRATYGVDEGINYKKFPEWSKQVLQVTGGHGADFIVDVGGKEIARAVGAEPRLRWESRHCRRHHRLSRRDLFVRS